MFHFVAADSEKPVKDYKSVRAELEAYNPLLLEKTEYVFISRSDTVDKKVLTKIKNGFKKLGKEAIAISIIDPNSMEEVKKVLNNIIADKTAQAPQAVPPQQEVEE